MSEIKYYQTEEIEKSRKKIRNGDVFVVKIKDHDLYFYGKVIDVKGQYNLISEAILIFLYKTTATDIIIPEYMDENDIIAVLITDKYGWNCGHFKTICNIPVNEAEKNFDFGFINSLQGSWITEEDIEKFSNNHEIIYLDDGRIIASPYVNAYNNKLNHKPKLCRDYSYSLYETVSYEISEYLHANPEIKKKYGL